MSRKPKDQVLGHADEADGIEEYDNPLPAWWLGLFYVTILFAVVYTIDYHFVSDRSQEKLYLVEMAQAAERWPASGPVAAGPVTPEMVAAGKEVFATNCVACHGAELQGGIGPDLTDAEWIHGGTIDAITRVVTEGVAAKGMPGWGPVLGPDKVGKVAAYVHEAGGGL